MKEAIGAVGPSELGARMCAVRGSYQSEYSLTGPVTRFDPCHTQLSDTPDQIRSNSLDTGRSTPLPRSRGRCSRKKIKKVPSPSRTKFGTELHTREREDQPGFENSTLTSPQISRITRLGISYEAGPDLTPHSSHPPLPLHHDVTYDK